MPRKYQIHPKNTDPRFPPIGKYITVEFREDCAGSCRLCVKKRCVYGIFKENFLHWSSMETPEFLYTCKSCLRCVEECTRGIFSLAVNPEYRTLGDDYWTAGIINSTWAQAHTGKVPVSGAGYRGPFAGEGFDSIWTDMSEIVRPTRDGIHGREYINTLVELSRRPTRLKFKQDGSLAMADQPILEIPVPFVFQEPDFGVFSLNEILAMAMAAKKIDTLFFIRPESYSPALSDYTLNLVPCLTRQNIKNNIELILKCRMIELKNEPGIEELFAGLRAVRPEVFISVGLPLDARAPDRALELAGTDVDTIHFYGTPDGREIGSSQPRYLKDMIREIHLKLVENRTRHKVNLLFSGGIAMAEHVAKSLICGADAVGVDIPLLLALECRLCYRCKQGKSCPVKLGEIEPGWGCQRIVNLACAWHSQLLEVMGAFGIREARRMRGEVGRSMWFEDLEKESFGPLFGSRKVMGTG
ncbi:MAG: glutamate synthase-related protein [Dehalococcoidales bacterium]|jgi:glutamate synthase domain-containing protein 2|nr:glutamate synthase-related protein [Dehalococcoidales bacterium]